jgi:hypothetical protein
MFSKTIGKTIAVGRAVLTVVLGSAALLSQPSPAPPSSPAGREFPVTMRQNVVAGKTPVGTKVQANLVVATLVDSVVIPRNALLSGEVTESVAKSKTDPSRLAIRMDLAQWKDGSAPIKVYLTSWYYPVAAMTTQDLSYEPPGSAQSVRKWNGMGPYPDKNAPPDSQPLPGRDPNKDTGVELPSPSSLSKRRVLMKDVDSTRNSDGAVTLTANRFNIKLDKLTAYVLAASDLLPTK